MIKSALLHTSKAKLKQLLKIPQVKDLFEIFLKDGLDKNDECYISKEF